MKQKVITGNWNGEEIWRWETPEETLIREGVDIGASTLYVVADKVKLV